MTPVLSTGETQESMALPSFTNVTLLENDQKDSDTDTQRTAKGTFTYVPHFGLHGLILNAAEQASRREGGLNTQAKLDRTGYTFRSRSYGAGASVGLMNDFVLPGEHVISYSYNESGFVAKPMCIYNSTSEWHLKRLTTDSDWSMSVHNARGRLPNGVSPIIAAADLGEGGALAVASGTNRDDPSPTHFVAFATGKNSTYGEVNTIQCEIDFQPTQFLVSVNTTNQTISVTPIKPAIVPINALSITTRAVGSINILGSIMSTTMYLSVIGDAFVHNVANVEVLGGDNNNSKLQGVTDSLSSIIDNNLQAFSAAQLMILNESTLANVEVRRVAAVFGSVVYVYAILAITLVISMIYLSEVIRTRGWRHLPKLNFVDVKSVVIGTSMGGDAIAQEATSLHGIRASAWHAAEDDHLAGQSRIRLEQGSQGGVAVVLVKQDVSSIRPLKGCMT